MGQHDTGGKFFDKQRSGRLRVTYTTLKRSQREFVDTNLSLWPALVANSRLSRPGEVYSARYSGPNRKSMVKPEMSVMIASQIPAKLVALRRQAIARTRETS
jgi:hypothetical protein